MNLWLYFLIFAIVGVAHEVFWTSILYSIKNKNRLLKGRSSLWMFLIYGGVAFIILFGLWLYSGYPWWLRGLMYMMMIYIWEYSSGFILKKFKMCPWDYSKTRKFNINGLICLEYAPIWFLEGLLAEWVIMFLSTVSF